jgi:hypothetical protein
MATETSRLFVVGAYQTTKLTAYCCPTLATTDTIAPKSVWPVNLIEVASGKANR